MEMRHLSIWGDSVKFKTLAAACDWNEGALRSKFLEGLDDEIQDEITTHELPHDLDGLDPASTASEGQRWATHPSWRLQESLSHQTGLSPSQPPLPDPEPMQLCQSSV